jgi:ketosteroid isomerase-like protein
MPIRSARPGRLGRATAVSLLAFIADLSMVVASATAGAVPAAAAGPSAGVPSDPSSDAAAKLESRRREVADAERGFAQTMARRDHAAFTAFLSPDAVFFSEDRAARGAAAVAAEWKPLFEGAKAPFSWEPGQVEVLDSGDLALSTGPVRDPEGRLVGSFSSIWRREAGGAWRIVFDKGCSACNCAGKAAQ